MGWLGRGPDARTAWTCTRSRSNLWGPALTPQDARVRVKKPKDVALQFSRRALSAALVLTALGAFDAIAGRPLPDAVAAEKDAAALVTKAVALPDMVLGSATAPITIVEYSSLTCPHCAAFAENVFPMLQSKYIDSGKVRFVSREFPLDVKAAAGSMLARCAANGDASKYFQATTILFKQQQDLV